ncbi:MAG: hypothetical protein K1X61_10085 [Chitinophagales bacterium]|nr:hypothetical protein [Chitinophagales bacterium]
MSNKIFRISTTLTAIILAAGIIAALLLLGKATRGPLSNFFSFTGHMASNVEKKVIIEQREDRRADKLSWFETYRHDASTLKNPASILFGAFDNNTTENFKSIIDLEDSLHVTLPLIHIYCAWGSKEEEAFPAQKVRSILELGSLPVITWEPWLTDFDGRDHPQLKKTDKRDKHGLNDVANGVYDFYISEWADAAAKTEAPIFLRVGHEMNDPYRYPWGPQNNTAKEFIAAFRHIHDLFIRAGANNVIWIYSPHPAYGYFRDFYPGDSYVDYIGCGTLNYGTVATWSKWWTFDEIFGKYYPQLSSFSKPVMLTEFGSLGVGGNRSEWFENALDSLPRKYPAVKAVLFFHFSDDRTTTQQALNWYFKDDSLTNLTIRNCLARLERTN